MLDWIEMDVIGAALEIALVADRMFPEALLPKAVLAPAITCERGASRRDTAGEGRFDPAPPIREIRIPLGQGHNSMQVIGENGDGIENKGPFIACCPERRAQ